MCRSQYWLSASVFALMMGLSSALGGDPQGYTLSNPDTGDSELDGALKDSSLLIALRANTPAAPFALIDRARGDAARFQTVLESFGYYKATIAITIAGHDIADKSLPEFLENVPDGQTVEIKSVVDHGPRYSIGKVSFEGISLPGFDPAEFAGISTGDPAVAADVVAGQTHLLQALQQRGYAFAKVPEPDAFADDTANRLDIAYTITPGPRVNIGAISFHGLEKVHEHFVRENLAVKSGDLYNPDAIEEARLKLVKLGVFSGVSVRAADHAEEDATVPLVFDLEERQRHAVALSGNYSTDLGVSFSAAWSHRNLLGDGEQLNLSASGIGIGGTATSGIGYNLSAQFIKPRLIGGDQDFEATLASVKQSLDAYAQTAQSFGVYLRKRLTPQWNVSVGLTATNDLVSQEGSERTYQLIALPLLATYDGTEMDSLLADPTRGGRASFSLTPTVALGKTTSEFVVLQASGSYYLDLSTNGRSVLALRGLLGSIQGGSTFDLPPDQRLYAGGSGSVRGFKFQSIGPHFASGNPAGASSTDAVTVEFRQRFLRDYGIVAFADAGQASADNLPFNGSVQIGGGLGLRYYSPIGAVRVDVAVPVTRVPNGDRFELYIGIGQAF